MSRLSEGPGRPRPPQPGPGQVAAGACTAAGVPRRVTLQQDEAVSVDERVARDLEVGQQRHVVDHQRVTGELRTVWRRRRDEIEDAVGDGEDRHGEDEHDDRAEGLALVEHVAVRVVHAGRENRLEAPDAEVDARAQPHDDDVDEQYDDDAGVRRESVQFGNVVQLLLRTVRRDAERRKILARRHEGRGGAHAPHGGQHEAHVADGEDAVELERSRDGDQLDNAEAEQLEGGDDGEDNVHEAGEE